jgi:putative transposon-encoded protein
VILIRRKAKYDIKNVVITVGNIGNGAHVVVSKNWAGKKVRVCSVSIAAVIIIAIIVSSSCIIQFVYADLTLDQMLQKLEIR